MTLKELQEKRAELAAEVRKLADLSNDEGHEWTSDDEARWKRVNAEYDRIVASIERHERALKLEALEEREQEDADEASHRARLDPNIEEQGGIQVDRRTGRALWSPDLEVRAFNAWARGQYDMQFSEEDARAARALGINPRQKYFDLSLLDTREVKAFREEWRMDRLLRRQGLLREHRAQSVGTTTAGGYTVPQGFVAQLEKALLVWGNVRGLSDVIRTEDGRALPWPTVNDTSQKGALLAENTQDSAQDATFGQLVLNAYKYTSKIILVSQELLEDSALDVSSIVFDLASERLARIQNEHLTTGTGTAQPNGCVTASAATTSSPAASLSTITPDETLELITELEEGYAENATIMMKQAVLTDLRKQKYSGSGEYVFAPGQGRETDTLFGVPISTNSDMPGFGANNKILLYGDFSRYKVREVRQVRFYRMVERYRDYDQDGFVGFFRFDGDELDAGTNPLKHMACSAT